VDRSVKLSYLYILPGALEQMREQSFGMGSRFDGVEERCKRRERFLQGRMDVCGVSREEAKKVREADVRIPGDWSWRHCKERCYQT